MLIVEKLMLKSLTKEKKEEFIGFVYTLNEIISIEDSNNYFATIKKFILFYDPNKNETETYKFSECYFDSDFDIKAKSRAKVYIEKLDRSFLYTQISLKDYNLTEALNTSDISRGLKKVIPRVMDNMLI